MQELQFFKNTFHSAIGVAEKLRSSDAREDPAHALKNRLALHVLGESFQRMIAVAVALDGEPLVVAFDDQIDSKSADSPLRGNLITGGRETFHDLTFEG